MQPKLAQMNALQRAVTPPQMPNFAPRPIPVPNMPQFKALTAKNSMK